MDGLTNTPHSYWTGTGRSPGPTGPRTPRPARSSGELCVVGADPALLEMVQALAPTWLEVRSVARDQAKEHLADLQPGTHVLIDMVDALSDVGGPVEARSDLVLVRAARRPDSLGVSITLHGLWRRKLRSGLARALGGTAAPGPAAQQDDPASPLRGSSASIEAVREQIRSVARFKDVSILILGETGTGKELAARAIHELDTAQSGPFVAFNCAAIPASLFESELFGHAQGAYTGARGSRAGLMADAGTGTLFLDEAGEMPQELQAKLLRALETRSFRPVGTNTDTPFRARVVAATNRAVHEPQRSGLRSDLLYRLAGFTIVMPPLRERLEDIGVLATSFADDFAARYGRAAPRLSSPAQELLAMHSWPGNVRELRAVVEKCAILAGDDITAEHVMTALNHRPGNLDARARSSARQPSSPPHPAPSGLGVPDASHGGGLSGNLRDVERTLLIEAFLRHGRNITHTARHLGLARSTVRDRLRRYGVATAADERKERRRGHRDT